MIACVANKTAIFGCHFIYIYIYIYIYLYIYVHIIHINCTKHCIIDICVHFGHLFSFLIKSCFYVRSSVYFFFFFNCLLSPCLPIEAPR